MTSTRAEPGRIAGDPHFKLLSFLITSARGCVDEPQLYGPLRLIDAAARLIDIMESEGLATPELLEIRRKIREGMNLVMFDEEGFIRLLDELSRDIAMIIKRYMGL
ncbi:MAG: DUF6092 family protein [Pyrodictiaceae archaeon]